MQGISLEKNSSSSITLCLSCLHSCCTVRVNAAPLFSTPSLQVGTSGNQNHLPACHWLPKIPQLITELTLTSMDLLVIGHIQDIRSQWDMCICPYCKDSKGRDSGDPGIKTNLTFATLGCGIEYGKTSYL
ncbi:hypothetical protein A6R68_20607 [Neotoma lepida]|uniref:Uncharacterized protein n=1 Tax=Neotoma lepida TaxID=56216 RepID=A0A1A6HSG8_NEOLE|nr:hypothetical protein A6R68_20607 [Neotoma lepida]